MVIFEKAVDEIYGKYFMIQIKLIRSLHEDGWHTHAYLVKFYKIENGYLSFITQLAYPATNKRTYTPHNLVSLTETLLRAVNYSAEVYRIRNNIYINNKIIPKKVVWLESWLKNSQLSEMWNKYLHFLEEAIDQPNIPRWELNAATSAYIRVPIAATILP